MLSFRLQEDSQLTEEQAREIITLAKEQEVDATWLVKQEAVRLGLTDKGCFCRQVEVTVLETLDELVLAGVVTKMEDLYARVQSTGIH